MTDAEKAGRLVFPGFKFGVDDPAQALSLVELGVGGFCLYGGEIGELSALAANLQAKAAAPLLFAADYEDGVFSQCRGGTALPSNMGLGASGSEDLAYQKGVITGHEAKAMGVRWVFAPVCDLATLAENPIVNTRAFSSDPRLVTRLARAYIRGLRSAGVLACVKHFPGHGETRQDSHLELPLVKTARAKLFARELIPFKELAQEAGAVMTGHLTVPALVKDKKTPYSLSDDVARTLRGEMGFTGLVTTDALNMQAIAKQYNDLEAAMAALLGGSDIMLVPASPRELVAGLMAAAQEDRALSAAAVRSFNRLEQTQRRTTFNQGPPGSLEVVGCPEHQKAAELMAQSCLAWARRAQILLKSHIRYWEPEADSADDWLGQAFVAELRDNGFSVVAFEPARPNAFRDPLVVGCFLSPRAYSGRIRYSSAEAKAVRAAMKRAAQAVVVSFGSPFVFESLGVPGLCAFSRNEAAQKAAARALSGRIKVTGRMPVKLSL